MVVRCVQVSEKLNTVGLRPPVLEVLVPDHQSYRALLMQPSGPIFADRTRIGHWNQKEAALRCHSFLQMAKRQGQQLVVMPEYCLPLDVLAGCMASEVFPGEHAIWVLGCESMSPEHLEEFKRAAPEDSFVLHELDSRPAVQGSYYDPVAYCFVTRDTEGVLRRVILFQFKTGPSRDEHYLENENLRIGTDIYQFRAGDDLLRFSAIICSDAFSLRDDASLCRALTQNSLLVHIQLNPKPRHAEYKKYRTQVFSSAPLLSDCDILCLNWAQNVTQVEADEDNPVKWKNIGGSAWYLPKQRCSTDDHVVLRNESKGIYYSLLEKHRHVLLLHYDEAIFEFVVPKIANAGAAVQANTLGPQADARYLWDAETRTWVADEKIPDAGLTQLLQESELIEAAFAPIIAVGSRLDVERAVELSCGPKKIGESWHLVGTLESCQMKSDEVVYRTTFCMDTCDEAVQSRRIKVQYVATLNHILRTEDLPPQVRDIAGGGAEIHWTSTSPNVNVTKTGCLPALVAFIGTEPTRERISTVTAAMVELLRRENKDHKYRVAVCYKDLTGKTVFPTISALTRIDYDGSSMANISNSVF